MAASLSSAGRAAGGGGKVMGLSWKVWVGVAIAGLALGLYLRRKGSTSSNVGVATSYPLSIQQPGTGTIDGAVAGGGINAAAPALDMGTINDLLAGNAAHTSAEQLLTEQTQGLTDAIGSLVYAVPSSGGAGASAAGSNPGAVTNNYYNTPTAPARHPAPAAPKKPPAKTTHPVVKYSTFKNQVKLAKGQKLHYTAGKGYYAG